MIVTIPLYVLLSIMLLKEPFTLSKEQYYKVDEAAFEVHFILVIV